MKKKILLLIDLIVFIISLVIFWTCTDGSDALGYSVLFLVLLNPVCIIFCSLNIGLYKDKKTIDYLFPIIFGVGYVFLSYFTFVLANMISINKFELPNFIVMLVGILISYFGFGIGLLIRKLKKEK